MVLGLHTGLWDDLYVLSCITYMVICAGFVLSVSLLLNLKIALMTCKVFQIVTSSSSCRKTLCLRILVVVMASCQLVFLLCKNIPKLFLWVFW